MSSHKHTLSFEPIAMVWVLHSFFLFPWLRQGGHTPDERARGSLEVERQGHQMVSFLLPWTVRGNCV